MDSRRRRFAALLAVAGLLIAGCSSRAASGPARTAVDRTPATVVHVVSPNAANGTTVVRTGSGQCWTTSIAAPGRDVYRCLSGNAILDPCFAASGTASSVSCLADPWSKAVRLHLTRPLPKADTVGDGRLWALELADGTRCVAATGTVAYAAGRNLADNCTDGRAAEVIDPHARAMLAYVGRPGTHQLQRVAVRAVWHA